MKTELNTRKLDRDKQMYNIILGIWKWLKPYTTEIPRTDKDWDAYTDSVTEVKNALDHNLGVAEGMFLQEILVACNQYMIRREAEGRRAPN